MVKVKIVSNKNYLAADNDSHFKEDARLEHVIAKYDTLLKSKEKYRREYMNLNTTEEGSFNILPEDNPQLNFMREVLYNYLDRELKIERQIQFRSSSA